MAIFHLNAKLISRAHGRSATGACAYRAGEKITDERTGLVFDYTRKREVVYRQVFAPKGAPAWATNRAQLWNEAEKKEIRKDAQVAREIEVALPIELSKHQQILLLERFVHTQFVKLGMVADVCIHDKLGNPHAHILLTTREIGLAGFGPKNRDWNSKEQLERWRFAWASHANRRLLISGFKSRIDSRTLLAQGIHRVPTVHIGPKGKAMQAKGLPVTAIQLNHLIKENNMNETTQKKETTIKAFAKKSSNFFSMPITTDGQEKRDQGQKIFDREYRSQLEDVFEGWFFSYTEASTDIGSCLLFKFNPGEVLDYGSQMTCNHGNADEIKAMILLAKLKGWKGIHLTGTEEFKERAFVNAVLTGAYQPDEITGYTPSSRALEILEMAGKGPSQKKAIEAEQKFTEQQVGNNQKQKI